MKERERDRENEGGEREGWGMRGERGGGERETNR